MNILLVSATDMEIAPFRDAYLNKAASQNKPASGSQVKTTTPTNVVEIRFLTSGIGMLATAARLTAALQHFKPDLVIQAGIAGSFSNNLGLGAVYRVVSDVIADMGVTENDEWKDVFDMGLVDGDAMPYFNGKLKAIEPGFMNLSHIAGAIGITVNTITTDPGRMEILKLKYQPDLESMEGAALHFVCIENGIPFLQLRAVSNYIGERDKANWRIREAISNLNNTLSGIIEQLV